jgi:predicted aminopeptidase
MTRVIWMVIAVMLLPSCYLTKQGYRQVTLLMSREPVDKVITATETSELERQKLRFSKDVFSYAEAQGLKLGSAYEKYVRLPGRAVSYTVQAAKPTEMTLKHWWFPIVGRVPYLGFFDESDRRKEAEELRKEGYEVHEGAASAFSSLGWFSDPIYSPMLRRSEVELAHLYFHELTHRTVWLKDGVEFNENLAEFVGDTLTEMYFKSLGRENDLIMFNQAKDDYQLFRAWLGSLRKALENELRASQSMPEAERVFRKTKTIELAVSQKPAFKQVDFVGSEPWNNARILAAGLYTPDTVVFEKAWSCFIKSNPQGSIGGFLKQIEVSAEKTGNGFEALESFCRAH